MQMRFLITGTEWKAILDGQEANRNGEPAHKAAVKLSLEILPGEVCDLCSGSEEVRTLTNEMPRR
jgi:hypothetical protein